MTVQHGKPELGDVADLLGGIDRVGQGKPSSQQSCRRRGRQVVEEGALHPCRSWLLCEW